MVFTSDLGSLQLTPGEVRVSAEGVFVPTPSTSLQHTELCYTGKAEHTGLTPFLARPRLAVGVPGGIGIELSYLPPVTVADATPNLASAAIWLTRELSSNTSLTLRAHGTIGTVQGPITCPKNALQQGNSEAPCYGTRQSKDEFRADMAGAEVIGTLTPMRAASRLRLSAGLGINALYPRFRVSFSDLSGGTDHTRILVNLARVTGFAGAAVRLGSRCEGSSEGYASFGDVATVRAILGCSILR
ncbi:MAG: hypothetical protein ACR2KM_07055 [Gemmatimonadaceae bacterium]